MKDCQTILREPGRGAECVRLTAQVHTAPGPYWSVPQRIQAFSGHATCCSVVLPYTHMATWHDTGRWLGRSLHDHKALRDTDTALKRYGMVQHVAG